MPQCHFGEARIRLNGRYFNLHRCKSDTLWCRRVVLQTDIVIPPRSEVDVPTKAVLRKISDGASRVDSGLVTEVTPLADGVYVSRTAVPGDKLSDLPVRVMNVCIEPVALQAGTNVSNLEPVEILGSIGTGGPSYTDVSRSKESREGESDTDGENPQFINDLLHKVHDLVPESACLALENILKRYSDVFSTSADYLGLANLVAHSIDTGDAKPVRQALRRHPLAHQQAISEQVDSMLQQGIIEPAASPWASNLVLVRKKGAVLIIGL